MAEIPAAPPPPQAPPPAAPVSPRRRTSDALAAKIRRARVAIENTINSPEILRRVGTYGYDLAKMQAGLGLVEAAEVAANAQDAAGGARSQSTETMGAAFDTADATYKRLAQIARAEFAGDASRLEQMGLVGKTPRDVAGLLRKAGVLYSAALGVPEIASRLAACGYPAARLTEERAVFDTLGAADNAQEAGKGGARQATAEQDDKITAMDQWTTRFRRFARVACQDAPALLEELGIPAR